MQTTNQQQEVQSQKKGESKMTLSQKSSSSNPKSKKQTQNSKGMTLRRFFTKEGVHPFDEVQWELRTSKITNPDGSVVFSADNVEVPAFWSQLATDIAVSKYFRKAGVPAHINPKGYETSVKQLITRVVKAFRAAGEKMGGYFKTKEDAEIFEAELTHLLVHQKLAFNSPVWFNVGLYEAYGIKTGGGNYFYNTETNQIEQTKSAYEHPQCSACFIQSVEDDLMSIFELVKNEARIFKYGSGSGTNFSKIRGSMEKLSGGGISSGLMSFLEVLDRGAGATKSGGTTRRAAKMVILDIDHPEIEEFINWKVKEEKKVAALIAAGYSSDFNGEAYRTVSGQNSNNTVRVTDEFMKAVEEDGQWSTRLRTTGEVYKTYRARDLWKQIAEAAWACADPGLQFDTTINEWHTCLGTDRIYASNPCSEYMFLDNTACNLASINLLKFLKEDGSFDLEGFRHACRISILAQEIAVGYSSYPTPIIAQRSHEFRTLGLGYANLGTLLMVQGIPYDSELGRTWCAAITAIMTATAYATSALIAKEKGAFEKYEENKKHMMKVMKKHQKAAYDLLEKVKSQKEMALNQVPSTLLNAAKEDWDLAVELGEKYGYRNAQTTVLAPTGTIGLLMDCDTTGIEPDFALVKFKKLAGGGYFKIVNQSIPEALKKLNYNDREIAEIIEYAMGTLHFRGTPHINYEFLKSKGFLDEEIKKMENALTGAFHVSQVFSSHTLGEATLKRLGLFGEKNILKALGLTDAQIDEANDVICGRMTVEGAPHLKEEHLAVFDCANKCGSKGKRFIDPMGHIKMMAAAQPFLSGAISKTVNLPHEATVEDIEKIYMESWKLGLKAVALYRDGCKLSQPLSTSSKDSKESKKENTSPQPLQAGVVTNTNQASTMAFTPMRRRLPRKRGGFTVEAKIDGHKVYLRTGEYEDGKLGEIFIDMHKEGAPFRSMLNCFAIAVSLGLQYGVPLEDFVDVFTFTRFEPQGMVDHPNIKSATSVIDFIFRVLGMEYLHRTDFVHVKPEEKKADTEVAKVNSSWTSQQENLESNTQSEDENQVSLFSKENDKRISAGSGFATQNSSSILSQQLAQMMGDAPLCNVCGHTTVRNGACYKCLNCGNSLGCS